MTNKGKRFTFFNSYLSDNNKSVFSKGIQVFSVAVFLIISISTLSIGLWGVFDNSKGSDIRSALISAAVEHGAAASTVQAASFDYSRPHESDHFAMNSGGPFTANADGEDAETERLLRIIQTTSDPASIPTIWAHLGKINNEFGFRRNPFGGSTYEFHGGMDIDGERGDLVIAPASGVVTKAGWQGGYGNMLEVDHGNGLTTRYGHLSKIEVEVGDTLTRGQLIALVGSSGRSTGPHLHYELRVNDHPINPRRFLPVEPVEIRRLNG
jgi:murein DD-endopeptidase MepM/ murein hydrolase activator NlpD